MAYAPCSLDIHYGISTDQRVKTDLDAEQSSLEKIEEAVGPEGTAAAMRIRDRLVVGKDQEHGLFFCHGFCELGAYPVVPVLREVRDFMVEHPDQVIILVIEDYVSPEDLKQAFDESGLTELVDTLGVTPPWATLRQLIDANQRVIVFTESGRPGVAWLHPTLGTIQETPYTFHQPSEFSCRPNRGDTTGSLFQINHWIETTPAPKPSQRRAGECLRCAPRPGPAVPAGAGPPAQRDRRRLLRYRRPVPGGPHAQWLARQPHGEEVA